MDLPIQWTLNYLQETLPPSLLPIVTSSLTALSTFTTQTLAPLLTLLLDRLTVLLASSPNAVALAVLVVLAVAILQVLALVRRIVLFWTRLALRLLFWAALGLLASVVWQRGVERSVRDAAVIAARVGGWAVGVARVWWSEFERAQAQLEAQRRAQQQMRTGSEYRGL
ncbi:hypothetical protein VTK26DRAFT_6969 [Humicola hyalothermophila]